MTRLLGSIFILDANSLRMCWPFVQVTANRLLQSKQTIPHYYLTVDARVDKLVKYVSSLICDLQSSFRWWNSIDSFITSNYEYLVSF